MINPALLYPDFDVLLDRYFTIYATTKGQHLCVGCRWCAIAEAEISLYDYKSDCRMGNDCEFYGDKRYRTKFIEWNAYGEMRWVTACPYYKPMRRDEFYFCYLHSPNWHRHREQILKRDKYTCTKCGSTTNLNVHHLTYDRLGFENDDDLITLCQSCHAKIHGKEEAQDETC